jgi:hypothetical protein
MPQAPLMILVAGPYRSGTNDDPARIGGPSEGADVLVPIARESGLTIFERIEDVPRQRA